MPTTTKNPPVRASQRAAIGWGLIVVIVAPLLFSQLKQFEHERSVRLLRDAGADVKVGLEGEQIVAVEFRDVTIDAATVRRVLEQRTVRRLSFTNCAFEAGTLRSLAGLPELDTLNLRQLKAAAPGDLQHLLKTSALISLTLADHTITSKSLELNTTRLRSVDLYRCSGATVELITLLARAPAMRSLRCDGTPLPLTLCRQIVRERPDVDFEIAPDGIREFHPLTSRGARLELNEHLEAVGLTVWHEDEPIPPELIRNLPNLTHVQLHYIDVERTLLEALTQLEDLQSLSLSGSRVDADVLRLLTALPRLRKLHLDGVSTTSGEDIELPSLPRLQTLTATSTAISDRTLDGLDLEDLEILSLGERISSRGLQRLLAPGTVHTLALSRQPVDAGLLETIHSCPRLRNLLLYGCEVKEEQLTNGPLPENLKTLRLTGTRMSPEAVKALRAAHPQLQVLFW
ncbi:MAG: hypothetical protein ACF8TS_21365 [Maioricimonas sp. JB049]